MGMPVQIDDEELRPLFVRVISSPEPLPGYMGELGYDAQVLLYMPADGSHEIDTKVLGEITREVKLWGFTVTERTRVIRDCGVDKVIVYTLELVSTGREPEQIEEARAKLNAATLGMLARVRYNAAGTAEVEEFFLDDRHIASRIILTVQYGRVQIDEQAVQQLAAVGVLMELCDPYNNDRYTFPVATILEHEDPYYPEYTASHGAQALGLFLIEEIEEPTKTPLHRSPDVVEVDI